MVFVFFALLTLIFVVRVAADLIGKAIDWVEQDPQGRINQQQPEQDNQEGDTHA